MKELNQIYKLQSSEEFFRSSIKILIFLCQLFGVAPVPLSFNRSEKLHGFKWKILRNFHQIWCVMILIGISTSFYFQHVKFNTISQYSQIKVLLHIGEYVSIISTCMTCVIGSQHQRNIYNQYFQQFIEIDLRLTDCGSRINFDNLKKFIFKCIAICFLFEFMMVFVFAMSFFGEEHSIVRNITLYVIPHIMVLMVLIKYCALLYAIQERCHHISLMLKKISFDLLFKKEYRQRQALTTNNKICKKINSLRGAFSDIAKLTTDINGSFGVLIICILISTFLILSTEFFAFYEFIEQSAPDLYVPCLSVLWIIFYGGRIIFILRMNHAVNIEKQIALDLSETLIETMFLFQKCKLGCTLYDIKFRGIGHEDNMIDVESCLNIFSVQLLHVDISEKACGMVNLNLPLLKTIFGAITTYLVILIQFHSSKT